jgi:hypothetical protein
MDYGLLRREGLRHLERLGSSIWTDFNSHDPGVTMLEVLTAHSCLPPTCFHPLARGANHFLQPPRYYRMRRSRHWISGNC